jgi:trans-aconitate methyltransferase
MNNQLDDYIKAYGTDFQYAFDNNIILNWYPKRIKALTPSQSSLLELGIGHGYTTNYFSEHFPRNVVIDGSTSVIKQFRSQYPSSTAQVIHSYFEAFEANATFDVIVMGFILEHVDDPKIILRHFLKFLRPNGKCFIAVPNAESLHRRFGKEAGLLTDIMELGQGDKELGHKRLYTTDILSSELVDNGYRILRKEGIFLKPFMTAQLKSLNLTDPVVDAMCTVGIEYPELCAALLFEATAA